MVSEPPRGLGQQRLGADAVSGRHQHGVLVAVAGEGEQASEPADVADDLGPEGRAHVLLDALHRLLAGLDVDPGRLVALCHVAQASPATMRSSSPQWRQVALEHRLAQPDGDLDRVLAGEAGGAEARTGRLGGTEQPLQREVGQAVGVDVIADLVDGEVGGEQLAPVAGVHAVEARPPVRRGRDAQVHLGSARLAQHLHELLLGGAPHDRVVDDHEPLALRCSPAAG